MFMFIWGPSYLNKQTLTLLPLASTSARTSCPNLSSPKYEQNSIQLSPSHWDKSGTALLKSGKLPLGSENTNESRRRIIKQNCALTHRSVCGKAEMSPGYAGLIHFCVTWVARCCHAVKAHAISLTRRYDALATVLCWEWAFSIDSWRTSGVFAESSLVFAHTYAH